MMAGCVLNGSALGEGLIGGGDVMCRRAVAMDRFHRPVGTWVCSGVEGHSDWKD